MKWIMILYFFYPSKLYGLFSMVRNGLMDKLSQKVGMELGLNLTVNQEEEEIPSDDNFF